MSRPQNCQHFKQDGRRCGSPALRGKRYCYFHDAARRQRPWRVVRQPLLRDLPVIEDPRSANLAINKIINALLDGTIDSRTAGQLLFGLQSASQHFGRPPQISRDLHDLFFGP